MIDRSVAACQIELKPGERGQPAADKLKGIGIPEDLSSRSKRESRRIFSGGLGGHQEFLVGDRRRGPIGDKGQVEVVDDPVHYGIVGEERDESLALA
jgi:hypothetical protein